ncbi:response regulator [Cohnella sp. WQ 127256]|uniref:response regulator n=1 Tax=Cohnella sp. WQ 127256 TaxID=2938790 RepID=UPI0021182C8C|nr:response regulator [Cohnella sp. WQ 127256]
MINALVVDDEKLVRKGFIAIADWQAFDIHIVGEAKDGNSALAMLGKHEVDLLFVDISMPGMSGFELMEQVRNRYPKIKAVVLTCHHEFDYVQEALRLGAIDYIVKTLLNRNNVSETINRILKRLSWESRESVVSATIASTFSGAAVFCSFDSVPHKEILTDELPASLRASPLDHAVWMAPLHNTDSADWLRELPDSVKDQWQAIHIATSAKFTLPEAEAAIVSGLRPYVFYWTKTEPLTIIRLEDLDTDHGSRSIEDECKELRNELDNMKWLLYGKDWKVLIDKIEETKPNPDQLLALIQQLANDWLLYFEWDEDSLEHWTPEQKPRSWKQVKGWLSDMATNVQRRMVEMSLSREVVVCLLQAMVYMKHNRWTDLNQNAVAHQIGMSRSYFSQCYKKFTGMSFGDTLRKMRVEYAKELLLHTDLSVYEIASRIGFEDDKHFSRVFRERVGLYPTEFRMQRDTRG